MSWSRFLPSALALALSLVVPGSALVAQVSSDLSFPAYLQTLAAQARAQGVSDATVQRMIAGLTPNQKVIDLDRAQPGGAVNGPSPPFAPYLRAHVDAERIAGGRRELAAAGSILPTIEREYGVPGPILLAIWGHESSYGGYQGDFDLIRSLATLAWEGRRRDLFAEEFIALGKMIDRGVPISRLRGSWAGAFGNPQFLPSVYLRIARDEDHNGYADIWNSRADTLASIANYFRDAGWRRGEPWGIAVNVPAGLDRSGYATTLISPRCPRVFARHSQWRTMAEWRARGVMPQNGVWPADSVQATLLEPDGPGATAYLLTGNYRVILDYNCSNYYALSVGLLADAIAR